MSEGAAPGSRRPPVDFRRWVGEADVLLMTFDSLRYDVAIAALLGGRTPNLARALGPAGWERRESPGTFTLPAHLSWFCGFGPTLPEDPGAARPLALAYQGSRSIGERTCVFEDVPDVISGFAALGYTTLCVGGVGFFDQRGPLGRVLPGYFAEAAWAPEMGVEAEGSPEAQAAWALRRLAAVARDERVLLLINWSATHVPHAYYDPTPGARESVATQASALAHIDRALGPLLQAMTARGPLLGIWMADHGEAYGEDGRWGHRIAHPTVTTVPYAELLLGGRLQIGGG